MKLLLTLVAFIFLVSCASPPAGKETEWAPIRGNTARLRADLAACRLYAERYRNPNTSGIIPAAIESARLNRIIEDCMLEKGYQKRTNSPPSPPKQLPINAT